MVGVISFGIVSNAWVWFRFNKWSLDAGRWRSNFWRGLHEKLVEIRVNNFQCFGNLNKTTTYGPIEKILEEKNGVPWINLAQ